MYQISILTAESLQEVDYHLFCNSKETFLDIVGLIKVMHTFHSPTLQSDCITDFSRILEVRLNYIPHG